jgi:hypothetical protein
MSKRSKRQTMVDLSGQLSNLSDLHAVLIE